MKRALDHHAGLGWLVTLWHAAKSARAQGVSRFEFIVKMIAETEQRDVGGMEATQRRESIEQVADLVWP